MRANGFYKYHSEGTSYLGFRWCDKICQVGSLTLSSPMQFDLEHPNYSLGFCIRQRVMKAQVQSHRSTVPEIGLKTLKIGSITYV